MNLNRLIFLIVSLLVIAIAGFSLYGRFFRPALPSAERGRRVAEREGCFTCHGPGGLRGTANPGRPRPLVPDFDDLTAPDATVEKVREWIRDGVPGELVESEDWKRERDAGVLVMPAFGDRLTEEELEDVVAFVVAVGGIDRPMEAKARRGFDRATELGCFGCHGSGGKFAPPNPGSVKGYIPSWDGDDFPDLVHDRNEFREWVRNGISDRFAESSFARVYQDRANIRMPGYEAHLEDGDIDALWAYVEWLRSDDR